MYRSNILQWYHVLFTVARVKVALWESQTQRMRVFCFIIECYYRMLKECSRSTSGFLIYYVLMLDYTGVPRSSCYSTLHSPLETFRRCQSLLWGAGLACLMRTFWECCVPLRIFFGSINTTLSTNSKYWQPQTCTVPSRKIEMSLFNTDVRKDDVRLWILVLSRKLC